MEIKFNCPNSACRQRISVDESFAGKSFICPACAASLQVPLSKNIKFNCSNPGCGQHIVVDISESGRYVKCPACEKPLQVPGPPPKSIAAAPVARSESIQALPRVRRPTPPWLRLVYGWGTGAALFGLLLGGFYLRAWALMPKHLASISNEIFAVGRIWDAPVENHAGSMMLFAQDQQNGAGVYLVDLATLKRTEIKWMDTGDSQGVRGFKLFGWSPDDRLVAFAVLATNSALDRVVQELVVCDGASGQLKNSVQNTNSTLTEGTWLTTNTLAMENRSHVLMFWNLETDNSLGRVGKKGLVKLLKLQNKGPYALERVSGRAVAYVDKGNVGVFDVPTGHTNQLTHFADATIEWLDYSPATGKYLFCATHGGEVTNRFVYELMPGGGPVQRTTNYSMKGQWIGVGNGISYVTTAGSKTCLTIDSPDESLKTNIFSGGSVRSYGVTPKRDKIYAVAALRYKAQSIWEYDIAKQTFRDVLPVEERSTSASKIVLPVMASVTNQSNEAVDYYFVPPANMMQAKKYPVILDLYPVNRYDQNVQMLVNGGIFYVAANRFGLNDWQAVAKPEDILAIYAQLLKNPNIDPSRIYIYGRSFSTGRVTEMANEHPELWRGVLLFSPVAFPTISESKVNCPRIFIAEGDEDATNLQNGCFDLWRQASRHFIQTRIHMEHAGHGFSSQNYKNAYEELIPFILTD